MSSSPRPAASSGGGDGSGFAGGVLVVFLLLIGGGAAYYFFTQTEGGKKALPAALAPPVQEGPATFKLTRLDQLPNAAHRHTVWVNGQKAGMIANGATNSFEFTARSDRKTTILIEAYDPFVENPKSNQLSLDVLPGDVVVGNVEWKQNGWALELHLTADVTRKGQKLN